MTMCPYNSFTNVYLGVIPCIVKKWIRPLPPKAQSTKSLAVLTRWKICVGATSLIQSWASGHRADHLALRGQLWIRIQKFSFKKIRVEISGKYWLFCINPIRWIQCRCLAHLRITYQDQDQEPQCVKPQAAANFPTWGMIQISTLQVLVPQIYGTESGHHCARRCPSSNGVRSSPDTTTATSFFKLPLLSMILNKRSPYLNMFDEIPWDIIFR